MKTRLPLPVLTLLAAGLGLLTACQILPAPQADTVRHFTLSAPGGPGPGSNGTVVRPVQLAGYLHGRQMAVRVAEHEVIYLADVRWAESLDEAITQLLRVRLGAMGSGATVTVEVQRCELDRSAGDKVQLMATYVIGATEGGKLPAQRGAFTATPRRWEGKDYGALVGQLRDAIGELGEAIAAALPEKK